MEKVLIVDDSDLFRECLRETLHSRMPNLIISEAKDRKKAMEIVQASLPDLIFMEIRLRDGNGFEITHQIKDLHPSTKVVIVSGYDQPEYREAAFRCKADLFVPKDTFMELLGGILRADHLTHS